MEDYRYIRQLSLASPQNKLEATYGIELYGLEGHEIKARLKCLSRVMQSVGLKGLGGLTTVS